MSKIFCFFFITMTISGLSAASEYRVVDINPMQSESNFIAGYINDNGLVAGTFIDPKGGYHVFIYFNDSFEDIESLRDSHAIVRGINNKGQIVGEFLAEDKTATHAFLYVDHQLRDLGKFGDNSVLTIPYAINDSGEIVGTGMTPGLKGVESAFIYAKGEFKPIAIPGYDNVAMRAINNNGEIIGLCSARNESKQAPTRACMYKQGKQVSIGVLDQIPNTPYGLNNHGTVIGLYMKEIFEFHGFIYGKGILSDIDEDGLHVSCPSAVNDTGQVVGSFRLKKRSGDTSQSTNEEHAFIYTDGVFKDLNSLMDPEVNIKLTKALSINSLSEIVALASINGVSHLVLLKPEPQLRH